MQRSWGVCLWTAMQPVAEQRAWGPGRLFKRPCRAALGFPRPQRSHRVGPQEERAQDVGTNPTLVPTAVWSRLDLTGSFLHPASLLRLLHRIKVENKWDRAPTGVRLIPKGGCSKDPKVGDTSCVLLILPSPDAPTRAPPKPHRTDRSFPSLTPRISPPLPPPPFASPKAIATARGSITRQPSSLETRLILNFTQPEQTSISGKHGAPAPHCPPRPPPRKGEVLSFPAAGNKT